MTTDPSKQMKKMDTNNLCKYLGQNGISDSAITVLRTKNISGAMFFELTEEGLKDMGLTVDDMSQVLKFQAEGIPKTTEVSHILKLKCKYVYICLYITGLDKII